MTSSESRGVTEVVAVHVEVFRSVGRVVIAFVHPIDDQQGIHWGDEAVEVGVEGVACTRCRRTLHLRLRLRGSLRHRPRFGRRQRMASSLEPLTRGSEADLEVARQR